ncbi:hypothetical protein [Agromyces archimandritae]|uniref:Uncharacterized protein n=1 Tax=Agromyces archimandritae TaxID=2781962 RepID=A0A975FM14_9MICO|nr:hypothetical protein G127AT_11670 [Agromyces archimandritae]
MPAIAQSELGEDRGDMRLDGVAGRVQAGADPMLLAVWAYAAFRRAGAPV